MDPRPREPQPVDPPPLDPPPLDPLATVLEWHELVNAREAEAAAALAIEDVEVVGPHGSSYGRDVLRDWVAGAGITMTPLSAFADGAGIVVVADASWDGDDEDHHVATAFLVLRHGIARIARHDDLPAALADAGVSFGDAVDLPG